MRTTAWLAFAVAVAICVYVDAWRRGARFTALFWAAGASLLSLIVVPLWYAKRPRKVTETGPRSFAVDAWQGFSIIWAAAISCQALIRLLEGRFLFAGVFWYLSMFVWYLVTSGVAHLLIKRLNADATAPPAPARAAYQVPSNCRIEIGPTRGPWSTWTPLPPYGASTPSHGTNAAQRPAASKPPDSPRRRS